MLIAKQADQAEKDAAEINKLYEDRNALVLLAGKLARENHLRCGLGLDPHEPDWPVMFIDLPTGQVSWHLPRLSREYPELYRRAMLAVRPVLLRLGRTRQRREEHSRLEYAGS